VRLPANRALLLNKKLIGHAPKQIGGAHDSPLQLGHRQRKKLPKPERNVVGADPPQVQPPPHRVKFKKLQTIMSNTTVKNLCLSQPRVSQPAEDSVSYLVHTSTQIDSEIVVTVEVPGVDPSTVNIQCENNTLHVTCPKGEVIVPVSIASDTSKIEANILWGLLTIRIPLPEAPVAHAVKVNILDALKKSHSKKATEELTTAG
jgi:HSP20 family molecular chaperone IbpA